MAYDASIFQSANKPTVALRDPTEMLGNALAVQNRLASIQEVVAKRVVGEAYQQATGPDGTLDVNKLRAIVAQDPRAALGAAEANSGAQQLGVSKQDLAMRQSNFINQSLGAVLDLPDGQLHDGVVQAVMRAKTAGLIDDQGALRLMGNFPNDPGQLRTRLRQVQLGLQAPSGQQEQIYGRNVTLDSGGRQLYGVEGAPARGGGVGWQTGVDKSVSPEFAGTPRTVQGPDGRSYTAPQSDFLPPAIVPPQLRKGGGSMGSGRYPGADGGATDTPAPGSVPPGPVAPASPAAIPGAGGAPIAGPEPGQAENREADIKQYRTDLAGVADRQTAVQSLQKAQHALEATFVSGRGAEAVNKMLGVISTIAPDIAKQIGAANANEQFDLAHKYLLDYARKSGAAAGSDAQLQASLGSNAGTEINKQAALQVVKTNIGRERQRIAQVQSHGDPNGIGYGSSASKFASDTDPRAFAWDTYTPSERAEIEKKAKPEELKKLDRSLAIAAKLKLIQVPGTAP